MELLEFEPLTFEDEAYMLRQGLLTNDVDLANVMTDKLRKRMGLSPSSAPALWNLPPKKFQEAILRKAERAISISKI